jgi:protein-S-isoprenylcysteine O-methyltransferase Ste14
MSLYHYDTEGECGLMRASFKKALLLLGLCALLLPVMATAAQEAASQPAAQPPALGTLIFLLGAAAIVIVGGAMIARDNYREDSDES